MSRKQFTCLDLFSGAGGLSRGFYDAGYEVVLGVDFDEAALKTFQENHGQAQAMQLDLFHHENIDKIESFLLEQQIELDVLVGGPPCQGFSIAGPRDMNDKRNSLYLAMVKLADRVRPQAVVLENVPGMLLTNHGIGAERVKAISKKSGTIWYPGFCMRRITAFRRYAGVCFLSGSRIPGKNLRFRMAIRCRSIM